MSFDYIIKLDSLRPELTKAGLTAMEHLALGDFAKFADDNGFFYYAASTLIERFPVKERQAWNVFKSLKERGLIIETGEKTAKGVKWYQLILDDLQCIAPLQSVAPCNELQVPPAIDCTPHLQCIAPNIRNKNNKNNTPSNAPAREEEFREEEKAIPPDKPKKKQATRLPENWELPEDYLKLALEEGLSEAEARHAAKEFKNYWLSRARDPTRVDWKRTWHNWVLKEVKWKKQNGNRRNTQNFKSKSVIGEGLAYARTLDTPELERPKSGFVWNDEIGDYEYMCVGSK